MLTQQGSGKQPNGKQNIFQYIIYRALGNRASGAKVCDLKNLVLVPQTFILKADEGEFEVDF